MRTSAALKLQCNLNDPLDPTNDNSVPTTPVYSVRLQSDELKNPTRMFVCDHESWVLAGLLTCSTAAFFGAWKPEVNHHPAWQIQQDWQSTAMQ